MAVVCEARVVRVDGTEAWFQLEARDETDKIARSIHTPQVIREDRFAARVRRKELAKRVWSNALRQARE